MLLKKMSKTRPKEYEDYQNEIKKKETEDMAKRSYGGIGMWKLSPELADIVGHRFAGLAECLKELWAYLKKNNLQDPENMQYFTPDKKMAKIFGSDKVRAFGMAKYLSRHTKSSY